MAEIIEYLRMLRDDTGSAVLFVHHTGHQGEHMRGSSDLESAWETRLRWKRDGQASVVTIESEHREAEAAPPFDYRIAWDGLTRSMRFDVVEDSLVERVRELLAEDPDTSANTIYDTLKEEGSGARKTKVLDVVKSVREGGSQTGNHPGTTPSGQRREGGSPDAPFRGPGTTPTDPSLQLVPDGRNHPSNGRPRIGDGGYLAHMYSALAVGLITEDEWHRADRAHRFVVLRRARG